MKANQPLALAVPILALLIVALVMNTTGCGSEEVTTTQATAPPTTAAQTSTTAVPQSTTATSAAAAMASTTTTAPSRPVTTELRPGEVRLDNGHVQAVGYIIANEWIGTMHYGNIRLVPAELVTEEEAEAGVSNSIPFSLDEPRQVGYVLSPETSVTVYTLGDGGERSLSLDEFVGLWRGSPLEGGEHLRDALWLVERDENAVVVSITEQQTP
jgi:hypothetical protein